MKIKQMAVVMDQEGNETFYALSESGKLFQKMYVSMKAPTAEKPYAYDYAYYWEPVVLEIGKPERFNVIKKVGE